MVEGASSEGKLVKFDPIGDEQCLKRKGSRREKRGKKKEREEKKRKEKKKKRKEGDRERKGNCLGFGSGFQNLNLYPF